MPKPLLTQVSELLAAISGFAWPVAIVVILYALRHKLDAIVNLMIRKFEQSSEIEFGSIKIKGVMITQTGQVIRDEAGDSKVVPASKQDVSKRHEKHDRSRNLMLVHTIRPTEPEEYINGFRVFDTSIYLHPHRKFGRLNDVKQVTYFFGDKWGEGRYGSKFVVNSSNEQFALTAQMFGSCLCVAEILFQDGTITELDRYLDVEMAPIYGVPLSKARD
ncbi:MAG TPA: pYEATS domain-containing protein [Beijerinckiaceae bacterium]|jgi:hypothetical protein